MPSEIRYSMLLIYFATRKFNGGTNCIMTGFRKYILTTLGVALLAAASPTFAAGGGNSVTPEIMNQSKSLASVIMSRVNVLWSDYIDKQLEYTNNPSVADPPEWADEIELEDLVGGTAPDGITFAERDMPAERNDSFNLEVTVGPQFGGAASARYIRAFLPTATVEGNIITVPVTRPSKALGLADLQIKELTDVEKFTMASGADIEMANGDITGVNDIQTNTVHATKVYTTDLEVTNQIEGNTAHFAGTVDIEGNLTVGPEGNNGHLHLGDNGYIHGGTGSDLTIGGETNTSYLANLIVNADLSQFKGRIEAEDIRLIKDGVTTDIGSTDESNFTIDSTQPIILSQAGTALLKVAENGVDVNANLTLKGDLLPYAHNTYDIGKSGNRWKDIYASGKFFGNVEGNVHGYSTDLKVGDSQDNPYALNVTWARQASRATNANSADNAVKFFNEGGSINGILYANKGVMAKATGNAMWNGWNQVYGVNTGSHGAFHNPTGGAFVGLHNNAGIYFGKSLSASNGQYYGWINNGGYYNSAGQKLATEAFVKNNATVKVNVYKYFTANTTFTVPSGVSKLTVAVTGAGGGGGGYTQYHTYIGGGGGGGGGYIKAVATVTPGQKLSITVGKAGAGGGHSGENGLPGGDGGASSIAGYITCQGGTKGYGRSNSYKGGTGGTCSYTSSKLSGINYVAGKNGVVGAHSDYRAPTNSQGGASAHGTNTSTGSSVYGAGGWGGIATYTTSYYNGRAGGPGLVQIWYKTDISNITF